MADVAYDEDLADRVRAELGSTPTVEKKMFGGLSFLVNGNMSVGVSGQGGLMVRCAPEETDDHLAAGAEPFVMRDKAMDGWVRVPAERVTDDAALAHWVTVGVTQATSLPPK